MANTQDSNESKKPALFKSRKFRAVLLIILVAASAIGILYWESQQGIIYIEKSQISAPIISLSPAVPGILERVFVSDGDYVHRNAVVATVGGQPLKSMSDGIVVNVQNTPGQLVSSQTPIVQIINPQDMRVIGQIQEDKGLSSIEAGQRVVFTVDAFDQRTYQGVVESVSLISSQQDIVFSISNQRQENNFAVKVMFDVGSYPELRSGMSAKMWVYQSG